MGLESRHYEPWHLIDLVTYDTLLSLEKTCREMLDIKKKKEVVKLSRPGEEGMEVIVDPVIMQIWNGYRIGLERQFLAEGLGGIAGDLLNKHNE